jgi:hypothetical protein
MTMPASNNSDARRYLDLLRDALCRDRFPDARYEMSSGSLQLMPFGRRFGLRVKIGRWKR